MHTCAKHTNSYTAAHLWELLASTLFCISIIPTPSRCAISKRGFVLKLGSLFPEIRPLVNDCEGCQTGNQYPGQGCQIKLSFLHFQFLLIFGSYCTRVALTTTMRKTLLFVSPYPCQNCVVRSDTFCMFIFDLIALVDTVH